jgi:Retrotransposon gag protein
MASAISDLFSFVDVPDQVRTLFVKEPPSRMMAYRPQDFQDLPVFLKKNFPVPKPLAESELAAVESKARECLESLREFRDVSSAHEFIAIEMGKIFDPMLLDLVSRVNSTLRLVTNPPDSATALPEPITVQLDRQLMLRAALVREVWVWFFIARAIDDPPSARELALMDRVAVLESELRDVRKVVQGPPLPPSDDSVAKRVELVDSSQHLSPRAPLTRRPPAPIFTGVTGGEKPSTDVITWLKQFDSYSQICCLQPHELVAHASLCLSGRAAKEWALISKALVVQGKDVNDFEVFKSAMLSQFVDADVESTVRVRLQKLKQTGSVTTYHAAFRAIMVEAVKYPVTGPEACSYFRAGLKPVLLEQLVKDSSIRQEMSNLEIVVQAAKEAESYLAMLAGLVNESKAAGKRPAAPQHDQTAKRPRTSGASTSSGYAGPSALGPALTDAQKEEYRRAGRCYECGKRGHRTRDCKSKTAAKPATKPAP